MTIIFFHLCWIRSHSWNIQWHNCCEFIRISPSFAKKTGQAQKNISKNIKKKRRKKESFTIYIHNVMKLVFQVRRWALWTVSLFNSLSTLYRRKRLTHRISYLTYRMNECRVVNRVSIFDCEKIQWRLPVHVLWFLRETSEWYKTLSLPYTVQLNDEKMRLLKGLTSCIICIAISTVFRGLEPIGLFIFLKKRSFTLKVYCHQCVVKRSVTRFFSGSQKYSHTTSTQQVKLKQFVKVLPKGGESFKYMCERFPPLSGAKLKHLYL